MSSLSLPECVNSASPFYLSISYNEVADDSSTAKSWGVPIALGTPPQDITLRPSLWDKTLVAREDDCLSDFDYDCLAQVGGTYNANLSTTVVNQTSSSAWNSTISSSELTSDFFFYQDTLTFPDNNATGWGFPFTTWSEPGWTSSGYLGLGRNSAFLKTLVDVGQAAISSWGLWPGSRSFENPLDGLLIVGAYDTARVEGSFYTYPSNDNCPACLQITDISWVAGGSSTTLFDNATTVLQVALNPYYNYIELPQDLWTTFMQVTGGVYNTTLDSIAYPAAAVPSGTLNVTIKDGYSVSIPAIELFTYPRRYSTTGNLTASTTSIKIAQVYNYTNSITDRNILATWGLPFLTMNYLVLDPVQDEFRIAKAIRQDFGSQGGAFPKKLCEGLAATTTTTSSTASSTTVTPTPTPTVTSPTATAVPSSSGGTNTGAIVGGVVGGVGGLLLFALALFFCFRRRNRRPETILASSTQPPYDPAAQNYHSPASPVFSNQGMSQMSHNPQQGYQYGPGFYPNQNTTLGYSDPNQHYYNSSALPNPEQRGASPTQFSDATAVPELPSPPTGPGSQGDWHSSQGGSDFEPGKHMSATITTPLQMPGKPL